MSHHPAILIISSLDPLICINATEFRGENAQHMFTANIPSLSSIISFEQPQALEQAKMNLIHRSVLRRRLSSPAGKSCDVSVCHSEAVCPDDRAGALVTIPSDNTTSNSHLVAGADTAMVGQPSLIRRRCLKPTERPLGGSGVGANRSPSVRVKWLLPLRGEPSPRPAKGREAAENTIKRGLRERGMHSLFIHCMDYFSHSNLPDLVGTV
ncbi:unnamed protein product [Protopolystoma xenopodis]|uniref:Uncharacterized protein n=1 Tax=Protopolystoma xenopodis TaxID=117903 RepID=A0A448WCS6_9PLAT|nr:unnamed protein product [Protopolystoma xenopodis]